jgi:hypothetical protein
VARTRLLGLVPTSACVVSVTFAASAQARGRCECGVPVAEVKGGESRLVTSKGTFRSSQNSGPIELTRATGGFGALTFEALEAPFGSKCNSAGEPSGKVQTVLLGAELGWISRAKEEVGFDLKPVSGAYLAELECEGVVVKLKGSVIGHVSPNNVSSIDMRLDFFGSEGAALRNEPQSFEAGPTDVLTTEFSTASGVEQETVLQQSNIDLRVRGNASECRLRKGVEKCKPGRLEVSTIANPAQPEFGRCRKKGPGTKYADPNCTTTGERGKYGFAPVPE